jgi:hypothetical protein
MKILYQKNIIVCFTFVLLLVACNPGKRDWEKTKEQNTIEAYKAYIEKYRESEFLNLANFSIDSLEYLTAINSQNPDSLEYYLETHLAGEFLSSSKQARDSLDYLIAFLSNDSKKLKEYLNKYPDSKNRYNAEKILRQHFIKDAIEWLIATYILIDHSSLRFTVEGVIPPNLSQKESERLDSLGIKAFNFKIDGVTGRLGGAFRTIEKNGYIKAKLKNNDYEINIQLGPGEIGLKDDKVFIKEGTIAIVDNLNYQFVNGVWNEFKKVKIE